MPHRAGDWQAGLAVNNPANVDDVVGYYERLDTVDELVKTAEDAQPAWNEAPPTERAQILRRAGSLMEAQRDELIALLVREAGKTLEDAIDELREAVDFCYYYAAECERLFATQDLTSPTGETNQLRLEGRGVWVCISPWNFPLAIFTGQVAAALAAGNSVIAKPAEQTTLIAQRAVSLLHQSGIPAEVLQLAPGKGSVVGAQLVAQPRLGGVAFTGSTAVAKSIQASLTEHCAEIVPLIAETGGQNCMVVDSSAMPEQVVDDVIRSAFGSAGQRCSALRVLCLQADVADDVLTMLQGAMDELIVGDPWQPATDVGPIIDADARQALQAHLDANAERLVHRTPLPDDLAEGHYLAPSLLRIEKVTDLATEHFGPILHVRLFERHELDTLVEEINSTGFGLTFGIHSRNDHFIRDLSQRVRAGNVYVNRNMIGAVVGVQPFGGRGLSGSGPKAGGPNYLPRFAAERTITNNVAAIGGNLELLTGSGRAET